MTALAWPLVALVALGLVWLRTRPMGRKDREKVLWLESRYAEFAADVTRAEGRLDAHDTALLDLKKRLESADIKKLGRTG